MTEFGMRRGHDFGSKVNHVAEYYFQKVQACLKSFRVPSLSVCCVVRTNRTEKDLQRESMVHAKVIVGSYGMEVARQSGRQAGESVPSKGRWGM